jgi:WD40 repeat protein
VLAHHSEQRLIAWGEDSGTVHVLNLDQPARRWQWSSEINQPNPQTFSPDGELLALIRPKPAQGVELREVKTGRLVLRSDIIRSEPRVRFGLLTRTLFAHGGRRFVAAGSEADGMQILFWDLSQPEKPPIRFSERGGLRALSVSPDGRWVAAGSDLGLLVLYDAATMERRGSLPGLAAANSITFSPDSQSLATPGSGTDALKLWQLATGQELLTLPGMVPVNSIAFAESGNSVIVGSTRRTGSWQMWRAPSWEVIHAAEAKDPPSSDFGGQGKAEIKQP